VTAQYSHEATVEKSFSVAVAHHRAGRSAAAELLYREILKQCPDHAPALHLLGVLALQSGRYDAAADFNRRALALAGDVADFHHSLGVALHGQGSLDAAASAIERAIILQPGSADALNNLCIVRQAQGRFDEAIACAEQALALRPGHAEAQANLRRSLHGDARRLKAEGRLDAAIARYRASLPIEAPALDAALPARVGAVAVRIAHPADRLGLPPEISVIVPCYRAAGTLVRAVRSILDQAEPAVEIILIDDASPDDTLAAALALARQHPAITVLARESNGGPGAARNDGIGAARGSFICFLDADDEYAPGFLRAGLDRLRTDPALVGLRTGIELAGFGQEIDPLRQDALVNSLVGNLMLRRPVLQLLGGFSEAPAFRGETGGEDVAFSDVLAKYFALGRDERPLLIYHVEAEISHFRRFMARTRIEGGRIHGSPATGAEESGLLPLARLIYERACRQRLESQIDGVPPERMVDL
jgi:tetratricopeptide (TPR) repeat protein